MAQARQRETWQHTAALSALVASLATGKPHRAEQFNPLARREPTARRGLSLDELAPLFKKGKAP